MGKLWKNYEKNSVEKNNSVGKVWESCEKNSVEKIAWEKCEKYLEKI